MNRVCSSHSKTFSNALITREKLAEARISDEQAVAALESSVQLATERYINGKSSYLEVLQAQQELYYPTQARVDPNASRRIDRPSSNFTGRWATDGRRAPKMK